MFLDLSELRPARWRTRSTEKTFLNLSGLRPARWHAPPTGRMVLDLSGFEFDLSRILSAGKMFLDLSGLACAWSQFGWGPARRNWPSSLCVALLSSGDTRRPTGRMFLDLSGLPPLQSDSANPKNVHGPILAHYWSHSIDLNKTDRSLFGTPLERWGSPLDYLQTCGALRRTALPSACSPSRLKARELRRHIKGYGRLWQSFCYQIDPLMRPIPEKMRRPIQMPDTIGIEAHQTRTGEVRSYGIVSENDLPEMPMRSVQRPVTFHDNNAVRDDEVHWRRRTDIEDASVDALPMQNVLGPAILCARHYRTCFSCST